MEFVAFPDPSLAPLFLAVENGIPVILETRPRALVYLGAVCDGRGQVQELMEIWTQDFSRDRDAITRPILNVVADQQWRELIDGYASVDERQLWRGAWEDEPIPAMVMGGLAGEIYPVCEDAEVLRKKMLPSYHESEFRYLVTGEDSLVSLSPDAPDGPGVKTVEEFFGEKVLFNREGGRLMVRRAASFDFGRYVDFLGSEQTGALRKALRAPAAEVMAGKLPEDGNDRSGAGFIQGRSSVADRVAEVFFLKLCALRGAMGAVEKSLEALRVPFGGLGEDSFVVNVSQTGTGLPFLWTQDVQLCDTPRFVQFPLGPTGEGFPLAIAPETGSIYAPPGRFHAVNGTVTMHVRKITAPEDGKVVMSGTLRTSEPLDSSRKDLLRLQFAVRGGKRCEFFATLDTQKGDGEWRFLSYPMELPEELDPEKVGESGVMFERVNFDLFPGVGATRDLYSFGVLAFRVLFSATDGDLGHRLDEFQSMLKVFGGGNVESEWATGAGRLLDFINTATGEKWQEEFGPQNVATEVLPGAAKDAIPKGLWWNVVGWVGQLFPGAMQGSFSRNLEDYDRRAPHIVMKAPLERLDDLIEQARLLLFGDPSVNRDLMRIVANAKRAKK